jgi:hypothetical protein
MLWSNVVHRVLITEKNRLLREMLTRALKAVTHLEVVYPTRPIEFLLEEIEKNNISWVIVSNESEKKLPMILLEVMAAHPEVGVLEVARDGSPIQVKRLEIVEFDLDEVSLDELGEILAHGVSDLDHYVDRKDSTLNGS